MHLILHTIQSLEYRYHVVIGLSELCLQAIVCPIMIAHLSASYSLSLTNRKTLIILISISLLLPCMVIGVVFSIALEQACAMGINTIPLERAGTVPIPSITAGIVLWYIIRFAHRLSR